MDIVDERIEEYARLLSDPESALLKSLSRETHAMILQPRMLSGHLQGRFLAMISKLIAPRFIVEIGTYTGYSALCLAEGLVENGRLLTMDINEELASFTQGFFDQSIYKEKISYKIVDAALEIPRIEESIDLVFIDADKKNNERYFNLLIDKVRPGGLIIVDNVLWSGKIIDEGANDKSTMALKEFNQLCANDARVENVLLPIRDGLLLMRKK